MSEEAYRVDAPEPSLEEKYGELAAVYTNENPYGCSDAVYRRMFIENRMLGKLSATYRANLITALKPNVADGSALRTALLTLLTTIADQTLSLGILPNENPCDSREVFRDIVRMAHDELDSFVEGVEPPSLFPKKDGNVVGINSHHLPGN